MPLNSAFLTDLLSRIPAESRAAVQAALEDPGAADAVTFANNAAMRHSEYSRLHAQVQQTHREQTEWYEANKPALEAGRAVLEGRTPPAEPIATPAAKPFELPPDLVRKDDVLKLINEREQGAVNYFALVNTLSLNHLQQFGKVLDTAALQAYAIQHQQDLPTAYNAMFAEDLAAKAKAAEDARVESLVNERLTAERAKQIANPYPVAGTREAQPLDVLAKPVADRDLSQFSVEAAAAEYSQLAAQRPH
jgi:hypothetical protein